MNLMLNDMMALKELTVGQKFNTTNLTVPTDKKLVLPNTVASSDLTQAKMWRNVDSTHGGSEAVPVGEEFTAAFNSDSSATDYTVPDTYILTTKDEIGINVFVKDDSGNGLANVQVELTNGTTGKVTTAITDENGQVTFLAQDAGLNYTVKQVTAIDGYIKTDSDQQVITSLNTANNRVTFINKYDGITPELPVTGSADRLWLLIVMTLILVSGGVTLIIRTKRRREQNIAELKKLLN